jgi:hypothetical protein
MEPEDQMTNYSRVPVRYMAEAVQRYIEEGVPTGSFLTALFSNDLIQAFRCADAVNTTAMREWAMFMVNEMPSDCQGSEAKVQAWKARGGIAGRIVRERGE